MNLFIYTGASRLNAAVVESATDLTPVSRLPDLIVGDSEPVTVKFLSASGAYESWSGGGTYTLSISIGALGGDGIAAYFQTSSFTTVTNGWTGRLNLASGSLPSVVAGYLAERPGAQSVPLFVQVRVTDADGNTETYARQAVSVSGAVSVPTTANSTPVTYATAADVAADASTASAAAIAAAASASAAAGSASTAAGHVTTAGNSATAAAASAVTAGNSATTASGHATTATTQATNAATSSSNASTYKDAAAVSASSATSSAGTATTQAALATTNGAAQVTLAAAQVTLATTQATNAGTSASAAAVSAAAALVSEAAALVSKNAAAASAATASAVSGSGNGTFSAAALTGVNSVTASASTALTLTGGSSGGVAGASIVLGVGASGTGSISTGNDYSFTAVRTSGTNNAIARGLMVRHTTTLDMADNFGAALTLAIQDTAGVSNPIADIAAIRSGVDNTGGLVFRNYTTGTAAEVARFSPTTGNLLIGTTTDMTGSGGLKIAGTTAATTTTSGALQVAGGAGFAKAIYVNQNTFIDGAAGTFRSLQYTASNVNRWGIGPDNTAESGANAGSDLIFNRWSDAGADLGPALTLTRSTGAATFANNVILNQGTYLLLNGAADLNSGLVRLAGNTILGAGGDVILKSGGTTVLTGTTTGAATFAGKVSLSAGAPLQIGTLTPYAGTTSYATAAMQGTLGALIDFGKSNAVARVWRMGLGIDGADEFGVQDLTLGGSTVFRLTAGTRGAAFTGAVTAGNGIAAFARTDAAYPGVVNITASPNVTTDLFGYGDGTRHGLIRGNQNGANISDFRFGYWASPTFTESFRVTTSGNGVGNASTAVNIYGTSASTGAGFGALQVAGGIYAGAASVFGGNVNAVSNLNVGPIGSDFAAGRINIVAGSDTVPGLSFGGSNYGFGILEKTDGNLHFARRSGSATNTTWLSVGRDTGAATFAGAVSIGNTVSSVSPTSPNRTITIVVGGVTLYIAAKTTND